MSQRCFDLLLAVVCLCGGGVALVAACVAFDRRDYLEAVAYGVLMMAYAPLIGSCLAEDGL